MEGTMSSATGTAVVVASFLTVVLSLRAAPGAVGEPPSQAAAPNARQAGPPQCRHDANESADEQQRRGEALAAARRINTLEANQPGARGGRYLDIGGLQSAVANKPQPGGSLQFGPGVDLLPGFELKLDVTASGYWFMIKDKTDSCGFAYVSNEKGVIYRSEPIR
jgi:hypothetical protein